MDVLVAVFLFGLSMLGLAQLGYASMLGNRTSQHMTDATGLAQERIEYLRNVPYDSVDAKAGTEAYGTISGYAPYQRVTVVLPISGMKEISVRVYWDAGRHVFELKTALTAR